MEAGKVSPLGGLTIVALAGLIGFTHPTQPEPPTVRPEVAKQVADLSAGLPNPDDNTVKAVCAHFGMSSARGDQDKCWERARAEKTLPIIATVPNPDEGHLALYFDRWVESIERAVSDSGFNFDRYWMPWKPEPASAESHQILRLAEEAQRQRAAGQPGLLLFRTTSAKCNRNNQSPSLLAVLLVGE
ncbi:MAG TPA: hypothetical protein VE621_11515, partial [Bryobacteraceae bacterium]|nr:hypothetical protein [Bryobacteraceae bacterium]